MNAEANTVIDHDTQQPVDPPTTTALAIVTKSIAEINAVEATIAELETKYKGVIFAVDTAEGMKEARKARAAIREPRYALQNMGKAAKAPLNELKRSIDDQIEGFVTRVEAIEDPVHLQITSQEKREEEEKQARIEAERKRVADLQERVRELNGCQMLTPMSGSALIAEHIADLEGIAVDESFQEFREQADETKTKGLRRLRNLHTSAVEYEAEQRRLADERERLRVEQERQKAEQQRIAKIRTDIDTLRSGASINASASPEDILEQRQIYARIEIYEGRFIGFEKEAEEVHAAGLAALDAAYDAAVLREQQKAEASRLAAERQRIAEEERKAQEARQQRERALAAIRTIQDRVGLAAEGDTLEAYDIAISCTESEDITAERFGDVLKTAEIVKRDTLSTLKMRRELLVKRLAAAAELEQKRLAQEAEEQRQAEQRAELARQEEALRLQQETLAKPSDPVEALPSERVALSVAAVATSSEFDFVKKGRPSDEAIVQALMRAFSEDRATIVDWLCDIDLMTLAEDSESDAEEAVLA